GEGGATTLWLKHLMNYQLNAGSRGSFKPEDCPFSIHWKLGPFRFAGNNLVGLAVHNRLAYASRDLAQHLPNAPSITGALGTITTKNASKKELESALSALLPNASQSYCLKSDSG